MSLSACDFCGGHISINPCSLNRCTGCGRRNAIEHDPLPPVADIDDSELVALRAEVAKLRKENEALKGIERRRWENVNKTFGTAYSTEQANALRPGDF